MRKDSTSVPLKKIGETPEGYSVYELRGTLDSRSTMNIQNGGYRRTPQILLRDGRILDVADVRVH